MKRALGILITGAVGFYIVFHPLFSHPVHWVSAFVPFPSVVGWFVTPQTLNQRGRDFGTALHYATRLNPNPEILSFLTKAGADPQAQDRYGRGVLHLAHSQIKKFEILTRQGADLHLKTKAGDTPLHYIMAYGRDIQVLEFSLKNGSRPFVKNHKGDSVLHTGAGANTHTRLMEWLLTHLQRALSKTPPQGENPGDFLFLINLKNFNGLTPLHKAAAQNPSAEMTKLLLQMGADPRARDGEGSQPLHWAVGFNSNPLVARALIEGGGGG